MEGLKDLLVPETFHWFSNVAIQCWILLGIILSAIFVNIENNEPTDFRCVSNGDKELIGEKCYEQYDKQYNKIPVYGFVIFNFLVTAIVCVIYSQAVKKRVEELERESNADDKVEGQTPRKKLFKAYCLQLLARFVLGISFVLLQTILLYPLSFPSKFNCNLTRNGKFSDITDITASGSHNITQTQTSYECHNQRAANKTFWANAVIVVTGTFALLVFIEFLYMLLWRARKVSFKAFTEDQKFHKCYLSSNKPTDKQTSVSTFIEHMKEHVRRKTERSDRDPFDPNPGEGYQRDQTLDQIYTNLVIHKERVNIHDLIAGKRTPRENSQPTQPGDIFDAKKRKILVVGRPGIGKTMFSTKILRNWASDNLFIEAQKSLVDFTVAFLIKLKIFNFKQDEKLSLRELLNLSEYSAEDLTEEVWKYILQNPNKVLIIFDGFDEYSGKTKVDDEIHPYRDNEQESMPIHILFKKIASGDILRGATVLTTTRTNALSFMISFNFDKTVEIVGFTTEQVHEYVQKFTKDDQKANAIKQQISSNLKLLSFCYIPVNCFIICSCLFQLFDNSNSASPGLLPTTLTEIYSIAVKYFYFRHHAKEDTRGVENNFLKPFKELSSSVLDVFTRLGKIALDGINEGKQIFESDKVKDLETHGLFHRLPDTRDRPLAERREQHCFLHLTIQEFLAAKYLVDTLTSEELRDFVSAHIQDGEWKFVTQFVAGLLAEKEEQSTDIFSDLLPSKTDEETVEMIEDSEERTKTLTRWPADEDRALVLTLFNCMYENKASDGEVQKKLAKIGCNALDFSYCNLSPLDCLALVHALKSVEGILDFDLRFNNLQSLGCIEIAKLLPGNQHNQGFCELKRLILTRNQITDKGVKHLSTALKHTDCKLNILNLIGNNITDEGVEHLSIALTRTNCKLNSLNLIGNNITDDGVENLSTALTHTNCKLNSLNLSRNNITDEGVKLLSTSLTHTNCKLNSLNLIGNNITDEGVSHLSRALTHTNCKLNRLGLYDNEITQKGKYLVNSLKINCKVLL